MDYFILLPLEIIIFEIFFRLPAEAVLECRQVCKTWRNLLQLDPYFVDMHFRHHQLHQLEYYGNSSRNDFAVASRVSVGLVFLLSEKKSGGYPLYYGVYDENSTDEQFTYKTLRRINHPPIKKRLQRCTTYSMVGSCNGLICFSEPQGYGFADPVHICNPITRECVYLPRLVINDPHKFVIKMLNGFGYDSSTNEYKVVRIYYCLDEASIGHVQVYTLGDSNNGWRNKGVINNLLPSLGMLANGALHWLNFPERKIMAFDLKEEKFYEINPSLPFSHPPNVYNFKLKTVGGFLCIVHRNDLGRTLDVWLLKMTKNSTTNDIEEQEFSWRREFSITSESMSLNKYEPFEVTKSGELLFWCNDTILSRYDPETATFKQLVDMKFLEAIPHMNSFVSLKALGENCRKRKYKLLGSGEGAST